MSLPYFNCLIVDKFPYCYSKLNRVKYSRAHLFEVDIIILHKNLRLEDNSALFYGSLNQNYKIIYVYDSHYWSVDGRSPRQFSFLLDCLKEVQSNLKELNSSLEIFEGSYQDLSDFIEINYPQSKIHLNHSTDTSYYRNQISKFKDTFKGSTRLKVYEDFGIQTEHFNRDKWSFDWNKQMRKRLHDLPKRNLFDQSKDLMQFDCFLDRSKKNIQKGFQQGGTKAANRLLTSFFETRSEGYSKKMSSPHEAEESCSMLSPHIAFGSISIREIYQKLEAHYPQSNFKKDLYSFRKRLYWHCHFIQKLETEPAIEFNSMHSMCDDLRPLENKEFIDRWINGETGFPFMDACMLYLREKGWINFRMRAMIMSFASYNLWQPWQSTSPLLGELFVDYEPGIHIPQVQMQSGVTGINLPRIYSVNKQSSDQDPEAKWIKQIIPTLNDIDPKKIHSADLHTTYISPVVDLKESSKYARDTIWSIRKGDEFKKIARSVYHKHGSRKRS